MTLRLLVIAALIAAGLPAGASAQATAGNPWRYGTMLSGFAGATAEGWRAHPAAGLALGWEVHPHVTIEGSALWAMPGHDGHEFGVLLGPRVNLGHRAQRVIPFVTGGVGFYRARFDAGATGMPAFYADRMQGTDMMSGPRRDFTDLLFAAGGGSEFLLGDHWAVQPDARLLFMNGDGHHRIVTVIGGHLAYHFVSRTITR